jgi:hypothetical protein
MTVKETVDKAVDKVKKAVKPKEPKPEKPKADPPGLLRG